MEGVPAELGVRIGSGLGSEALEMAVEAGLELTGVEVPSGEEAAGEDGVWDVGDALVAGVEVDSDEEGTADAGKVSGEEEEPVVDVEADCGKEETDGEEDRTWDEAGALCADVATGVETGAGDVSDATEEPGGVAGDVLSAVEDDGGGAEEGELGADVPGLGIGTTEFNGAEDGAADVVGGRSNELGMTMLVPVNVS